MKAKFINEVLNNVSREEDAWADTQIDNYLSQHGEYPLNKYVQDVINYIWKKLSSKMTYQELKNIDISKDMIEEIITETDPDTKHVFHKSVYDFYEDEIGFIEAAETLYSDFFAPFIEQPKHS